MKSTSANILYVEDNQSDVFLLEQAFEERLFQVKLTTIAEFDDALHYLQVKDTARDAPPPDLILLDNYIVKGDGAALMRFITQSDVLSKIPTFLYASPHVADAHGIDRTRCLIKAHNWPDLLVVADRLIYAIQEFRSRTTI